MPAIISDRLDADFDGSDTFGFDESNYWTDTVAADGGRTLAGFGSDADFHIDFSGATDGDFIVNTDDFVVNTSSGNVGIGVVEAAAHLELWGNGEQLRMGTNTGGVACYVNLQGSRALIGLDDSSGTLSGSSGALFFKAGGSKGLSFNVNNSTTPAISATSASLVGVQISTGMQGRLHVYENNATGARPPLWLEQDDVDQHMMGLECATIGTGNAIEAKGAKTLTVTHFVKVNLAGVGDRYFALGTIA